MNLRHFLASTSNCCSASFADETILASRWENGLVKMVPGGEGRDPMICFMLGESFDKRYIYLFIYFYFLYI